MSRNPNKRPPSGNKVLKYPCCYLIRLLFICYTHYIITKWKWCSHKQPSNSVRLVFSSILKSSLLFKGWLFTSRKKDIRYNGILWEIFRYDFQSECFALFHTPQQIIVFGEFIFVVFHFAYVTPKTTQLALF